MEHHVDYKKMSKIVLKQMGDAFDDCKERREKYKGTRCPFLNNSTVDE